MKTNSFNICPTCDHKETCILTEQKAQVWSCSEYEETTSEAASLPQQQTIVKKEDQSKMAMA